MPSFTVSCRRCPWRSLPLATERAAAQAAAQHARAKHPLEPTREERMQVWEPLKL